MIYLSIKEYCPSYFERVICRLIIQQDTPQVEDGPRADASISEPEDELDDLGGTLPSVSDHRTISRSVSVGGESFMRRQKKAAIIRHLLFVFALFVIWCIYSICLITNRENTQNSRMLTIPPNEVKNYRLSISRVRKIIGVNLFGPFQPEQDLSTLPSKDDPHLKMQVKLKKPEKITSISDPWGVVIRNPDQLEYVKSTYQEKDIDLTEDLSTFQMDEESGVILYMETTNINQHVSFKLWIDESPVDQKLGIAFGAVVLVFLYIMIIWECVNRTFASMIASTLAIGVLAGMDSRPGMDEIIKWIDLETLMLLFGMMVLVAILSESGVFDSLAVFAYQIAKGNLWVLIYVLCLFTSLLSAFLDNVTMMLLVTPVTIRLCEVTNLNPVPVLMAMIVYSNIGAALTPVGDPPNIIIMTNHYILHDGTVNFGIFILHMLPGVIIGMLTTFVHLRLRYRTIKDFMNKESAEIEAIRHQILVWERAAQHVAPTTIDEEIVQNTLLRKVDALKTKLEEMQATNPSHVATYEETLAQMKASYPIRNKVLLVKATVAFTFVLCLFFLHTIPSIKHLSLGWSALLGALLLLIIADDQDMDSILSRIEWSTLLFFACLFIMMEALSKLGVIGAIGQCVVNAILYIPPDYRLMVAILIVLWVTGIASAFLDNIPVTTMMVRIVINLAQDEELGLPLTPLVWALAFGACFGGNGTLIGASANVVASGVSEQHGYRFSFIQFFIFAFPITINTLVVATIYLLIAHCAFAWH
uniref:Citrate transporter-like domain-containing protein n=1 Tax=Glossina brevipalpis TaxID=37001 RepID=A0A1A9WPV7_9MUSC